MKKLIDKYRPATMLLPALTLASLLLPCITQAASISYNLSNHPGAGDGASGGTSQLYGLRLDGLLTDNPDEEYLFNFDHASSAMQLVWDDTANTIVITGTAFGGEDDGSGGFVTGTTGIWNFDITYDEVVTADVGPVGGTFDDLLVGDTGPNTGTLTSSFGSYTLEDHYSGFLGGAFIFGDNPDVSRDFGVLSGWGLLDYCKVGGGPCNPYSASLGYSNNWIFEARVPVPAAVWLFGSGLIGLIGIARRRKV